MVCCTTCTRAIGERQEEQPELMAVPRESQKLQEAPFVPTTERQQHPLSTLPYVVDKRKVANDEKLAWLSQELGKGAELPEFARRAPATF
eukprot:15346349-Alexandrium_andersonii.AAC.1